MLTRAMDMVASEKASPTMFPKSNLRPLPWRTLLLLLLLLLYSIFLNEGGEWLP